VKGESSSGSIRMYNSIVAWDASVSPFDQVGKNAHFSGNLFTRNGYALAENAAVGDGGSSNGLIFEHNTVTHFNSFAAVTPGDTATIAYNIFSYQRPSVDGAGVHVHVKPQNGILIYRNWAHDLTVKAFRFDRVNTAGATWGVNGTVEGNVAMRSGAPFFKGDKHHINNNLCFDVNVDLQPALGASAFDDNPSLVVMMYDPSRSWSVEGENAKTEVNNNVADMIFNISGELPGLHSGNIAGMAIRPMLQNPDEFDFRPKTGSQLVGTGPYPDQTAEYWIPGFDGNSKRRTRAPGRSGAQDFYARVRAGIPTDRSSVLI